MEKSNKNVFLTIFAVVLFVVVAILYLYDKEEKKVITNEPEYLLLKDYSRFFTVNSCVYKYINYVSSNKAQEVLDILDKDYVSNNKLTKDNVFDFVGHLSGNYSFTSKKIYYQNINRDYKKYFVYGYLIEESLDTLGTKTDYYLIVTLDLKNQLFSVTPYNGDIFKEVK